MIKNRLQRGFYLIEAVIGMSVVISLMGLGSRYIIQNAERSINQITANQLNNLTKATQQYVQDHYQYFKENSPRSIDLSDLIMQGYLSDQFIKKNNYNQDYRISAFEDKGVLQVLITTEQGQTISESSMRQIVAQAGSFAGYVSTLDKDKIVGNQGNWFLKGFSLKPGHLASYLVFSDHDVMDAGKFLRRINFPDHPEYNRMETDLEIDNHSLNLIDGIARSTVSSRTITLQNPYNKSSTKKITLDVNGTPMLSMKDTYNTDFGGIESLLSGDRLEFTIARDGNEIKIDNRNPSINVKNKNVFTSITPWALKTSIYPYATLGRGTISNYRGFFSEVGNQYIKIPFIEIFDPPGNLEDTVDICGAKEREGALFLMGRRGSGGRVSGNLC